MTKYYRVRTPEQWDWLMEHLELEYPFSSTTFLTDSIFMDLKDDKQLVPKISIKSSDINKIIEVSKLMEDEKMKNYVTIKGEDLEKIKDEDGQEAQILESKILVPTSLLYPKVKMTQAEKDEFDILQEDDTSLDKHDLDDLLTAILGYPEIFPFLYHRLYVADGDRFESQLEFARAWAAPSLIEVIPEKKWNVKIPPFEKTDRYYYKDGRKLGWADSDDNDEEDQQFTADELKEYGLDDDMYEKVEVKE